MCFLETELLSANQKGDIFIIKQESVQMADLWCSVRRKFQCFYSTYANLTDMHAHLAFINVGNDRVLFAGENINYIWLFY